jgi:hypothetical protein
LRNQTFDDLTYDSNDTFDVSSFELLNYQNLITNSDDHGIVIDGDSSIDLGIDIDGDSNVDLGIDQNLFV